jgi:hypothetical protein
VRRALVRRCVGLAAGLAVASIVSVASAQSTRIPKSNWRQRDRSDAREERKHSPWTFAFEVRFGPYWPEADEEFGGSAFPYGKTFAESKEDDPGGIEDDPQFYFGLEVDWLPVRIPFVGLIGPGLGWGFTTTSANAIIDWPGTSQDGQPSKVDTSLTIMPMHLSAVLRVDELMRRTVIPIVPYAKFGLAMAHWDMSEDGDTGQVLVNGELTNTRGVSFGTHLALGGALGLSWLGGRSNASLEDTTGIRNAFVFGEWMRANIDGIGSTPQFHAGTSTWVLGLAFQM